MRIKNLYLAVLALTVCLTSCNKDDENYKEKKEGVRASISISIPRITTYADDPNATSDEVKFTKADVFIYDGATLETHKQLVYDADPANSDFIVDGNHAYTTKTQIETTTGAKEVYVGLNLHDDIVATIKNSGILAGLHVATEISVANLTSSSTGFAMFSTGKTEGNFVDDNDEDAEDKNRVAVTVERLVAKVTVQTKNGFVSTVEGGSVSDLQFAMRNINKSTYAMKYLDGSIVKDHNWSAGSYDADDFTDETSYVAVNVHDDAIADLRNKYVTENTSEKHATQESTYASLRAKFIPETFVDEDGIKIDNPTWTAGNDFWTVTFSDGTLNYFEDEDDADAYALKNSSKGAEKLEYKDGYCYYPMFLDLSGGYNTIRNNFYKMTINSIKGLGYSTPEEGGNTEEPVPTSTNIDVDIDIAAWTMVEDGYTL